MFEKSSVGGGEKAEGIGAGKSPLWSRSWSDLVVERELCRLCIPEDAENVELPFMCPRACSEVMLF